MSVKPLWTVTVEPGAALPAVTEALREAGMQITDVLEEIGVVNGHAPAKSLEKLRHIAGVADVAPTLEFQLGPEADGA